MDEMMQALSVYPNGTYVRIEWDAAMLSLGGLIETIYQTNNGLPEIVSDYREFYAMAFRIKDVLRNETGNNYISNMVMEVSCMSQPSRVYYSDGTLIWQAPMAETQPEGGRA